MTTSSQKREVNHDLAARRRNEIAKHAASIFITKGYNETTMEEIAEPVGISKASLYNYVDSKEGIVFLILESIERTWGKGFDQAKESSRGLSAAETLARKVEAYLDSVNQMQDEYNFLNHVVVSLSKEGRRRLLGSSMKVVGEFESILKKGIESGEFKTGNAQQLSLIFVQLCSNWAHNRWYLRRTITLDAYRMLITELMMKMLGASSR